MGDTETTSAVQVEYERDGWVIKAGLELGPARKPIVSTVEVRPVAVAPASGLTPSVIAGLIDVDEILERAKSKASSWLGSHWADAVAERGQLVKDLMLHEDFWERASRGHSYPDALYYLVAQAYLGEAAGGTSRGLTDRLAAHLTDALGRKVTASQARTWIHTARKRGFLEPSSRGRVGAEPGPEYNKWLRRMMVEDGAD